MATVSRYPISEYPIQHFSCGADASHLVLGAQKLQQLQPYIFHCIQLSTHPQVSSFPLDELEIHVLSDSQAVFTASSEVQQSHPDMLKTIQNICRNYLWQHFVYEDGPVHHRPLDFHFHEPDRTPEWGFFDWSDKNQIYVTYNGEIDRFKDTMEKLKQLYPEALPNLS